MQVSSHRLFITIHLYIYLCITTPSTVSGKNVRRVATPSISGIEGKKLSPIHSIGEQFDARVASQWPPTKGSTTRLSNGIKTLFGTIFGIGIGNYVLSLELIWIMGFQLQFNG